MHAHPIAQQLLKKAEGLVGASADGRIGLVFQGVTAVSLGAMTVMDMLDRVRRARHSVGNTHGPRHP